MSQTDYWIGRTWSGYLQVFTDQDTARRAVNIDSFSIQHVKVVDSPSLEGERAERGLTSRLKELAAFDRGLYIHPEEKCGAYAEHARLRPLVEALIECVSALEFYARLGDEYAGVSTPEVAGKTAKLCLARLQKIAGEE